MSGFAKDTNVPTNDCISRQAAIDAICEHGVELERRGITVLSVANHKQATVDLLENLPSAERRGRWINGNEGIWNAVILPKCSICGETFYEMNVNINGEYPYNYCPNCGARMEAE